MIIMRYLITTTLLLLFLSDLPAQEPPRMKPCPPEMLCNYETMPLFIGDCRRENYALKKRCGDSTLLAFIYSRITYPPRTRNMCVEGVAVIQFTIGIDGCISNLKLVRDPGQGLGEEAFRVVGLINSESSGFEPGRMMNRPVEVLYNLPVKFKLE